MARIALLLLLACASAACSGTEQAYEGSGRDESQVAIILPENPYNRTRDNPFSAGGTGEVRVRVDGHTLGGMSHRFEVLPGRHDLSVVYYDPSAPGNRTIGTRAVTLPVDVVAGRLYAIRGTATWANGRPTVTIWAVDGTTRATIASVVVPQANVLVGQHEEWIIPDD
jgi:hypothetical protein